MSQNEIVAATRAAIDRVLDGNASADDVLTCIDVVARLKELTRELAEKSEAAIVPWLQQHGEIERGEVRYYAGASKSAKVKDNDAMLKAVLYAAAGDIEQIAKCLASGAWKVSAVRELVPPDEFEVLVEVVESVDLKTGKPKVKVQKLDPTFMKGRSNAAGAIGRAGHTGAET
jgi:hypothetical protein